MLAIVRRIAGGIALPVSADVKAGYGDREATRETVARTIEAGAVGVNLEDGTGDPDAPLVGTGDHAAKVRAAREAAEAAGVPVVVNARTDVFWSGVGEETTRLKRAVARANAYLDAGADCAFVPGVMDSATIEALAADIDGPLNILGGPGAPSISGLANLGVARVSVGSGPMRSSLAHLRAIATELGESGTYGAMTDAIPYAELNRMLEAVSERRGQRD
jgi:2-methylisocitrate lyase-like PEP mutase family enzyme